MKKNQTILTKLTPPTQNPILRFTPTAWAKLLFLRDAGESEIGGFGVTSPEDLLLVERVQLVRQTASWVHVEFDDASVADFFDAQVDAGRRPQQFARIWIHTHPGNSPQPSQTDEATFERVFGNADWAVMFILARGGQTFARLRYNVGPGADLLIPIDVDYRQPFGGSDADLWEQEYAEHVQVLDPEPQVAAVSKSALRDRWDTTWETQKPPAQWVDDWYEYTDPDETPRETDYGYVRDI